ncbi:MAG: gluconate 2-dehydrogenase subunit 3 family protein [Pirellulales bacterium]
MRDDQYVLNHCTAFLARLNRDRRHDFGFGHYEVGDARALIREAWRFPIIDTCSDHSNDQASRFNDVTFVYRSDPGVDVQAFVVGTFANLHSPLKMRRVLFNGEPTGYSATTVTVPKSGVFYYRFIVDGLVAIDPINPQRKSMDNGITWSRFFTWECTQPIVFQRWEQGIVERLCDHILPFRTKEAQRFLSWYYDGLSADARRGVIRRAYRLDDSAGAANYIDKVLAREEAHHLTDYRICLRQIERILRQREPGLEPLDMPRDVYNAVLEEMKSNNVAGWDYAAYGSPQFFLDILRRHAFTGAFSHPKYGGNASASGWAYLQSRFPFDWQQSLEQPLGTSQAYWG